MRHKIKLLYVNFLPIEFDSGLLYVSKKYGIAGHLCPCGCGNKIITPLEPTEWRLIENKGKPTLYPSIGNWQLPCKTHYWIIDGKIKWSYQWSSEQISAAWEDEENKRKLHFDHLSKKKGLLSIINKIRKYFNE